MKETRIMTQKETTLVEEHLYLIPRIIKNTVYMDESVQGLGYDDLYQDACLGLCQAAMEYRPDRGAGFATFASVVVRNYLISSCRYAASVQNPLVYLDAPLCGDENFTLGHTLADETSEITDGNDAMLLARLKELETDSSGCIQKGIQALILKCSGHSSVEIAKACGVGTNLVAAWISKAAVRLRKDKQLVRMLRA